MIKRKPKPVKAKPTPPKRIVPDSLLKPGLEYEAFFFKQGKKLPKLGKRSPNLMGVQTGSLVQTFKRGTLKLSKEHIKDFALRYSGFLVVPRAGKYYFEAASSDGSIVYIDKKPCVKNDGLHGYASRSCVRTLEKGQHHFQVAFFKSSQSKVKSKPKVAVTFKCLDKKAPRALKMKRPLSHKSFLRLKYMAPRGFKEEIFYVKVGGSVPNLNKATAAVQRIVPMVRYGATTRAWSGFTRKDNFAVRWSGILEIMARGNYRFSIKSDDGSKLFANGRRWINNDGEHGMRERSATKRLGRSRLLLVCEHFEKGGGAGMQLRYMGPDTRQKMLYVGSKVVGHYVLRAQVRKTVTPKVVKRKKNIFQSARKKLKGIFR